MQNPKKYEVASNAFTAIALEGFTSLIVGLEHGLVYVTYGWFDPAALPASRDDLAADHVYWGLARGEKFVRSFYDLSAAPAATPTYKPYLLIEGNAGLRTVLVEVE